MAVILISPAYKGGGQERSQIAIQFDNKNINASAQPVFFRIRIWIEMKCSIVSPFGSGEFP